MKTMVDAARQGARVLQAYAPQRGDAPSFEMEEPSERFMKVNLSEFAVMR